MNPADRTLYLLRPLLTLVFVTVGLVATFFGDAHFPFIAFLFCVVPLSLHETALRRPVSARLLFAILLLIGLLVSGVLLSRLLLPSGSDSAFQPSPLWLLPFWPFLLFLAFRDFLKERRHSSPDAAR